MSRYDDNWNRDSTFEQSQRRRMGGKGPRSSYLLTLALLVILSTLGVATINLLGYRLM
ncbi:MAG TPA: hypothetical protein VGH03_08845 [Caulobacteraceae bacterium]|jgi:hypothetical protein